MRIGELADRTGVSVRSLRYYEEQGLLSPERNSGGQRTYTEYAVERVAFFQDLFAAGLPSRRIAELLPCIDVGRTNPGQRAMLHAERERIQNKIDQLGLALGRLDEIIAISDEHADA
ncbi:MerR family transcriptional regulator [Microbacterium marinilacus]|uniref:MerR family transcriptional regulator n=1 Tax=Microbacterium marinilacus TaxID=415209 RepID=A0ABP7BLP7_9MICO|nr:MerR family transcriptional regulator [Microbacterium marinilacus]MBY0688789.1 MerR family transcriptional regulator [Microbacterium marinilacus]